MFARATPMDCSFDNGVIQEADLNEDLIVDENGQDVSVRNDTVGSAW